MLYWVCSIGKDAVPNTFTLMHSGPVRWWSMRSGRSRRTALFPTCGGFLSGVAARRAATPRRLRRWEEGPVGPEPSGPESCGGRGESGAVATGAAVRRVAAASSASAAERRRAERRTSVRRPRRGCRSAAVPGADVESRCRCGQDVPCRRGWDPVVLSRRSLVPAQMRVGASPVLVQMWPGSRPS